MKLDLRKYRVNEPFIKMLYYNDPDKDAAKVVAQGASAAHCPCAVLAFYLADHIGYTPELIKTINTLIKFYSYDQIIGQSPNSPYLHLS